MPKNANPHRLSDSIYDALVTEISSGQIKKGARLPAEMAIAEKYSVSRPIVREALIRLREDGLIRSRQGSGSYVERKPEERISVIEPLASIADVQRCLEFRVNLEPRAAHLAALRRTDTDLASIRRFYDALEEVNRQQEIGAEEDFSLHHAIARASQNRFFVASLEQLQTHIAQGMGINRTLSLASTNPRMELVQTEHLAVVEAIEAGDADAAEGAMETHLQNSKTRIFEG